VGSVCLGGIAVARCGVVVRPLVGVIEVSKWVQRTVGGVVVVAAVRRWVVAWGAVVVCDAVVVGVWGLVWTDPGIVAVACDAYAHAYADSDSDASVAVANAAVGDDASGVCAIGLLASITEEAALAVAGRVDVLMAWLGIGLHRGGGRSDVRSELLSRNLGTR
jgi:hypothetical protein